MKSCVKGFARTLSSFGTSSLRWGVVMWTSSAALSVHFSKVRKAAGLRLNLKQGINLASRFGSRFFCERNQQRAKLVRASRFDYYLRDHKIAGLPCSFGGRGGEDAREQADQSSRLHERAAITS